MTNNQPADNAERFCVWHKYDDLELDAFVWKSKCGSTLPYNNHAIVAGVDCMICSRTIKVK